MDDSHAVDAVDCQDQVGHIYLRILFIKVDLLFKKFSQTASLPIIQQ